MPCAEGVAVKSLMTLPVMWDLWLPKVVSGDMPMDSGALLLLPADNRRAMLRQDGRLRPSSS